MQNELYAWLKTVALKEQSQDVVLSTFKKLQSIHCDSPQDLIDSDIAKSELKDELNIPLSICVLIIRCLKSYSRDVPDLASPKSSTSFQIPGSLSISNDQQRHPLNSSSEFRVLNGTYVTKTKDPRTSMYQEVEVVAKISTSASSVVRLEQEYEMILFLNESAPGCFVQVRDLVGHNKIIFADSCDQYVTQGAKALVMEKGKCNLAEYVMHSRLGLGDQISICSYLLGIVTAAHSNDIVLMDLKPENIIYIEQNALLSSPWKGIDLEGCLKVGTPVQCSDAKLTVAYMPPELFQDVPVLSSFAIDAWATGMIVFFVFSSRSFWTVVGLSTSEDIRNFLHDALSNVDKTQQRIDEIIDKTFTSKDSLRRFLKLALKVDPSQRASVTMLQYRALITGESSVTTSSVVRNATKKIGDNIDERIEKLSSMLMRNHDEVKQQLQGLTTHKQLKDFSEKMSVEMKEGLQCAISESSDTMKEYIDHVVNQHNNDLTRQFSQLTEVVTRTGDLGRRELNIENKKVFNAVMTIQDNVEVLMDKMDVVVVSMKEIKTAALLESLEQNMASSSELSAEEISDNLKKLLDSKFDHLEEIMNSHDNKIQNVITGALDAMVSSDLQGMVKDIMVNVEALRTVQNDSIYGMHDIPLLSLISIPKSSNLMMKCKEMFTNRYVVQFLCPVCGRAAKAGPSGRGLELCVPKKWLAELAECLSIVLRVLEVAGNVGGLPIPRISNLVKSVSEAVPENVPELLTKASHILTEFTESNMLEYKLAGKPALASQRPTITLDQTKQLRMLLAALSIKDYDETGLKKAYRAEDGACAWVCRSSDRQCLKLFRANGRACLLIDPVYE